MNKWKNAATLMIAIRSNVGPQMNMPTRCGDYKMLVLRRHNKNSFMPTKIVFPGGVVSGADYCNEWNSSFESILGKQLNDIHSGLSLPSLRFPMIEKNAHWPVHPDIALRICAIRETFEECGILVALNNSQVNLCRKNAKVDFNSVLPDDAILEWRNKVLKNPFEFIRLCNHFEVVPNIWALMEWNNWLTPQQVDAIESKRFDTMFYLCCLEGKTFPTIFPHLSEIAEAYWASPADLLNSDKRSAEADSDLPPPQFYEITEFSRMTTLDELKSVASSRSSCDHKVRFLPVRMPCKDGHILTLPGDHLYPEDPENFNTNEAGNLDITIKETKVLDSKPKNRFVYQGGKISGRSFVQDLKIQS